jgi:SMODS and SLOG-associating 2TM effector domain family 5
VTGDRFELLKRRIRITAGARFNAARRLAMQERLTQWSIALASVALVIMPLLEAMQVTTGLSPQAMNVVEVVLAIFVLVFSLLLTRDNAAVRADKMHRCAIELNVLVRQIEGLTDVQETDAAYQQLADRYDTILREHENHETVDYELWLVYRRDEFYQDQNWLYVWRMRA